MFGTANNVQDLNNNMKSWKLELNASGETLGVIVEWNRGTIDQFSAKVVNKLKLSGMVYESTRNVKPPEGKKFTDQNIEF